MRINNLIKEVQVLLGDFIKTITFLTNMVILELMGVFVSETLIHALDELKMHITL